MYVLQCPEWVRLLYRKKEQVARKSQSKDGEQLPDIKSSESGDAGSETQTTVN